MSKERQRMGQSTDEIEGRLSTAEYEMLHELAKIVPSNQGIVEITCGQGEVAKCLARGAQAGQGNKVNKIILHPANEAGTTSDSIHTRETTKNDSDTTGTQWSSREVDQGRRKEVSNVYNVGLILYTNHS